MSRFKLTQSSVAVFRECPRKFRLKYLLKREKIAESGALSFGRLMHEALATAFRDGLVPAIEWLRDNAERIEVEDAARICAILENYTLPDVKVIEIEGDFNVKPPGLKNVSLRGRVDGIVEFEGQRMLMEHKTTSEKIIGWGDYWRRLAIDHQILTYCYAKKLNGVLYNVFRKPALRPRNGEPVDVFRERCSAAIKEAPEEYYQLRPIHFTDADLTAGMKDLAGSVRMIRVCEKHGEYPRSTNACRSIYGSCPYLGVCSGREDIMDDSLFRTKASQHEELTNV